jgi:hypothetical protein
MVALRRVSEVVFWVAVVWLAVAGLLAFEFWPDLPRSASGWAAFIAFGPPIYVLAEAAAEGFWSSRVGRRISGHPSRSVRVLLGVVVVLLTSGVLCAAVWLATKH